MPPEPPADRPRTHSLVLRRIEALLSSGRLRPGDRLPAERTLAETYGVGRASVREAIKVLEALGVVEVTGGQGRESGAVVVGRPGAAIGAAMRLHVATEALPVRDLVDTRVLLEEATVRQLADRVAAGGDALLAPARALLHRMDGVDDPVAFQELDSGFHLALCEAAGNAVVTVIMASLRQAVRSYVLATTAAMPDWPEAVVRLRAQHAAVLDAVAAGDGPGAARAVVDHIRWFHGRTAGVGVEHLHLPPVP